MSAPLSDLEQAEMHLLNAHLTAKRRCMRDELTREDFVLLDREFKAALARVRLLILALPPLQLHPREGATR